MLKSGEDNSQGVRKYQVHDQRKLFLNRFLFSVCLFLLKCCVLNVCIIWLKPAVGVIVYHHRSLQSSRGNMKGTTSIAIDTACLYTHKYAKQALLYDSKATRLEFSSNNIISMVMSRRMEKPPAGAPPVR